MTGRLTWRLSPPPLVLPGASDRSVSCTSDGPGNWDGTCIYSRHADNLTCIVPRDNTKCSVL